MKKQQKMPSTLKQLRKFFAAIPEGYFVTGTFDNRHGKKCAVGHFDAARFAGKPDLEERRERLNKLIPKTTTFDAGVERLMNVNDNAPLKTRAAVLCFFDKLIGNNERKLAKKKAAR